MVKSVPSPVKLEATPHKCLDYRLFEARILWTLIQNLLVMLVIAWLSKFNITLDFALKFLGLAGLFTAVRVYITQRFKLPRLNIEIPSVVVGPLFTLLSTLFAAWVTKFNLDIFPDLDLIQGLPLLSVPAVLSLVKFRVIGRIRAMICNLICDCE